MLMFNKIGIVMNYKIAYIFVLLSTSLLYPMEESLICSSEIVSEKDNAGEKIEEFDVLSKEFLSLMMKLEKGFSRSFARQIIKNEGMDTFLLNRAPITKTFSSQKKYERWITIPLLIKTPYASKAYFSDSGTKILTNSAIGMIKGSRPGPVHIFDVGSGRRISTLEGGFRWAQDAKFNKTEGKVVVRSGTYKASSVQVFDVRTGSCLLEMKDIQDDGDDEKAYRVAQFNEAGNELIIGYKNEVQLWDIATESELMCLQGHTQGVTSVVASCDDAMIISASEDGTAKIWDRKSGKELCTLTPEDGPISRAQFNETADKAYTITDHYLKVWSVENGECLHRLNFNECGINGSVVLNLQGNKLVSTEEYDSEGSKHLKVWDLKGDCFACFEVGKELVGCSFSRTGEKVFTSTGNGFARVFDLDGYITVKNYLLNGMTLPEAGVIIGIYEVIKLRRMVLLRKKRSEEFKKLLYEEDILRRVLADKKLDAWTRKWRTEDLDGIVLLKEKKIEEYGITSDGCIATHDGCELTINKLKFNFNEYAHLQPIYDSLPEPIKRALDPFVIRYNGVVVFLKGFLATYNIDILSYNALL